MPTSGQTSEQFETRDVRIRTSKEQWVSFDAWRSRKGYQSLAEAFRALMSNINEGNNNHQGDSEPQSARAG